MIDSILQYYSMPHHLYHHLHLNVNPDLNARFDPSKRDQELVASVNGKSHDEQEEKGSEIAK
jgi:hypothetical protein